MSYQLKQIEFNSIDAAHVIKAIAYIPTHTEPKGVVQITHGMCEDISRYRDFMIYLAENGYIAAGHDHLGHGATAPTKEEKGYFAPRCGWKYLVEDTYRFTRILDDMFFSLPIYLLGHSMGSFVARIYASKHGEAIKGLLISGTGTAKRDIYPAIKLAEIISRTKGERHRSKRLNKLVFGSYNKDFDGNTGKEWLSSDANIAKAKSEDASNNFIFTASAFRDLFSLIYISNSSDTFLHTPQNLPIYLFAGDKDPVGNCGKGVRKVEEKYRKADVLNLSCVLYPNGRHEMLNEVNRAEVYSDILSWLSALNVEMSH